MKDEDSILMIPGADKAVLGTVARCAQPPFVVYDYSRLVESFMESGMSEDEAVEWIEFNISGVWVGPATPGILMRSTASELCRESDEE